MCGIVGFYTHSPQPAELLGAMNQSIQHRGPDDFGFAGRSHQPNLIRWKTNAPESNIRLGLGFRRLSIIDLSETGAQPMSTNDGRYTIVFNGEIYNYVELRETITGISFRGRSDTEVLLNLLAQTPAADRKNVLRRLNGIFAFAFYDSHTGELFIARDQFGIKPLYYFQDERGIFFASEIRALLKALKGSPRLNIPLLSRYLLCNWIPGPDTLFDGILKLEPGCGLTIKFADSDLKITPFTYWDLDYRAPVPISEESAIEKLDTILDSVVDRQLRSDVPVAFFLSGGVDSSLLAARALKVRKDRSTTFTIGFNWQSKRRSAELDLDMQCARELSKTFQFDHREIILEPSIVSLLPRVVETLEEPIADPAAICSYLICEAASSHFKVLFSGQGGDEMFGGYPVYQFSRLAKLAQKLGAPALEALDRVSQRIPYEIAGKRFQTVSRLRKLFSSAGHPWPEPFFYLRSAFMEDPSAELLQDDVKYIQKPPFARHWELFSQVQSDDVIHQAMYLDSKTYLPNLNLTYTDKTSMAHSVEVRVPLLDMELTEFISHVPSALKINRHGTKILLKALAEKTLPRSVVHRKKTGFGLPVREWLVKDLQPLAHDLLGESRLRQQGFLNAAPIQQWLREHREGTADHSLKIYSLMTLQLWCESFSVRA